MGDRYHTKRCNSRRGPQYPCDCGNPMKPAIAAWNARTTDAEIERLTRERDEAREMTRVGLCVGNGLMVYAPNYDAIRRVQDFILLDSNHPVEKADVRRSLARQLQESEADRERLRSALEKLEKAASEVSRYGAQTGRQWVRLSCALGPAREALTSTSASHVLAVVEAARKLRDAADEGRSMNAAQSAMLIADAMKAVIESVRRLDTGTGATQEGKSDV